ncbi:MAG: hypothetical protein ABJO05_01285 [Roseibium sp.]
MVDDGYRAQVLLPDRRIALADGTELSGPLLLEGKGALDDVAFEMACSLIWIDGAKADRGEDTAAAGREEFCHWTRHWIEQKYLARQTRRAGRLTAEENIRLRDALTAVTYAIDNNATYPKYWLLRAELTALLPAEERNRAEIRRRSQNDQLQYLALLELNELAKSRGSAAVNALDAYKILAERGPAFVVENGEVDIQDSNFWKLYFDPPDSKAAIKRAARATGLIHIAPPDASKMSDETQAMGVAIGENLIATPAYSILADGLRPLGESPEIIRIPDGYEASFAFADAWSVATVEEQPSGVARHPIRRILYLGEPNRRPELAILEMEGHDVENYPSLAIPDERELRLQTH